MFKLFVGATIALVLFAVPVAAQSGQQEVADSAALRADEGSPLASVRDALRSGGDGPELVVIPAGSFRMGCVANFSCDDDEFPVHWVTISAAFAVGKYEVTFSEWDACVESGGCRHVPRDWGWGRGNRPVILVSWEHAQEYVAWLSAETGFEYRLLSESEWEYAARAGTRTEYSWGREIGDNRANCNDCGSPWDSDRTAPVGSFAENSFGLHDMHGNVAEWVEDCWNESYVGAPSDGSAWRQGDCSRRVSRGGSWEDYDWFLRSASRVGPGAGRRDNDYGFRVARSVARTLTPDGPCTPTSDVLQFHGGYSVRMCYITGEGETGQAQAGVWASSQSGILWFFNRENAEVLVKVLDGCEYNGHRWVFVAPVTDLGFELRITGPDGDTWTHTNQAGTTASTRSDTSAFRCSSAVGSGPELVVIPAGSFLMGCVSDVRCREDEFPVHRVTIPAPFAVGKYEVTFSEWDACVESGGCRHVPDDEGWGRGNRPVVNVDWEDAQEYVFWLSAETGFEYRLLSESEWEYAARAGTRTAYSWGDEIGRNRANCFNCGSRWDDDRTAPVGSFGANPFGLHDMHGNVDEWVEDCSNDSYDGAPSDGSVWQRDGCLSRVVRGGSWNAFRGWLRSASRSRAWNWPGHRGGFLGFRVARALTP